ncbi:deaminase [Actinoplanes sp. ATCC 53533]|uniref:dihydrofolate reductase family protein n=1 Tax=Actinoplanes sp. ATCC 53533 TaxID=1288362 RepID=UPI000F7829E7|nr:dihydrofolate reductase family protein [Actinoplanes sp. ATCC 53533]RSM58094.1 deaminase [Actinoplanes sp. ATCC 53533]
MGELVVVENVTLDGVMQAPGGAEEDTRGDFRYGGWARPYADHVAAATMGEGMAADGALLFGRRTYTDFHGFWAGQGDGNPYTEVLNRKAKYVVSRTLAGPLPWQRSTLLAGPVADAVARLKRDVAGDIVVLGSGVLVRSLAAAGLVDQYTLSIHPLILGAGTRLFDEPAYREMSLVGTVTTTTGVIIASYRPAVTA